MEEIQGQVIEAETGDSIIGAVIFVDNMASASSDVNGNFKVKKDLPLGAKVEARSLGFENTTVPRIGGKIPMKMSSGIVAGEVTITANGGKPWYKKRWPYITLATVLTLIAAKKYL